MANNKRGAAPRKRASEALRGGRRQLARAAKADEPENGLRASAPRELGGVTFAHVFRSEGLVDVEFVANAFGISKSQLAETIGIGREALYKRARSDAPKTQVRLREMLEIVGRVLDWAGSKEQALAWYRSQPISAFGGRTAESLVKSGEATALRDYLDHIAVGGYA